MIKPYTGPVGAEVDEAVYRAEKAGYTVVVLEEEIDRSLLRDDVISGKTRSFLVTKKAFGVQVSEILSVTGFLQSYGAH